MEIWGIVCVYMYIYRESCLVSKLCPTLLRPHGLQPTRLFCPWDSSGKYTGVGCHFSLQEIFPTQGSHLLLLHWQADSLLSEPAGKPKNTGVGSVQFSSVAQSCPTLGDPMNRSTPGLPVHHHLPEFTQTNVHRVRDAIQLSHPWSSPSPPAPNPSQHQSLFQ